MRLPMVPEPERRFKLTSGFPSRRRAGSWPTLWVGAVLRRSGRAGGLGIACHSPGAGSRHPVGDARRLGRWAFCHMGRVDALAAVRGLTADGGDGRVWSLASRWGLA